MIVTHAVLSLVSVLPMESGSANAYDYCSADPVNYSDTVGTYGYHYKYDLGAAGPDGPVLYASPFFADPNRYLPFNVGSGYFEMGARLTLNTLGYRAPVRVVGLTATSFTFLSLPGHPEGAGVTIAFSFWLNEKPGHTYLDVNAHGSHRWTDWWGRLPDKPPGCAEPVG